MEQQSCNPASIYCNMCGIGGSYHLRLTRTCNGNNGKSRREVMCCGSGRQYQFCGGCGQGIVRAPPNQGVVRVPR